MTNTNDSVEEGVEIEEYGADGPQIVTFSLGDERFAVPMECVQEIVRVPATVRVPLASSHLTGLANLRGRVLPVFQCRTMMGMPAIEVSVASRVLVLRIGTSVGLMVDRVHAVVTISPEQVDAILRDIPFIVQGGRATFELKVCGLIALFAYSFFKFGWSYRLFNYCTILFGAIPMTEEAAKDPKRAMEAAERTIRMNIIAASHFNMGLRAIFYSIGYLGWFVSPWVFMVATVLVFIVLLRRQFFSEARLALLTERDT